MGGGRPPSVRGLGESPRPSLNPGSPPQEARNKWISEKSLQNDKLQRRKLKLNTQRRISGIGVALNRHISLFVVSDATMEAFASISLALVQRSFVPARARPT
jgi:hypothetical protein